MLLYSFLGIIWVIPNFHPISANPGYGPPDPPDPPDPPREPRYQGLRRSRKRYSPKSCSPGVEAVEPILPIPYAPWCWNIYLQNWVIFGVNVGKYSIHGAYGNDEFGYWLWFLFITGHYHRRTYWLIIFVIICISGRGIHRSQQDVSMPYLSPVPYSKKPPNRHYQPLSQDLMGSWCHAHLSQRWTTAKKIWCRIWYSLFHRVYPTALFHPISSNNLVWQ